jgi:hypothetical protein
VIRHGMVDIVKSRHITLNERDATNLIVREQSAQAMGVGIAIKDTGPITALHQVFHHPRANESLGASNQKAPVPLVTRYCRLLCHARAL